MSLPKPPKDPREWKIYPRNLTARADYIVPGNPVPTRTEDGVDNCYPGLELDAKNIQKYFFPGLYFDVYRSDGAKLAELKPLDQARQWLELGLTEEDLNSDLYLWALRGRNNDLSGAIQEVTIEFVRKDGLYAWRQISSLLPGETAVAFGPAPAKEGATLAEATEALSSGLNHLERESSGVLKWAVLSAQRADYLDREGVLSPDVYEPGELTRTLCTPWTYDFRDCQCFYWASNKPDVISSEDGQYQYLNFQRKNRHVDPQTQDIAYGYEARRQREIGYAEMMEDWEQLRPVLNGREFGQTYVPSEGPSGPLMNLQEIQSEMSYLATVEHALAVQYLYAYYSIDVPEEEPDKQDVKTFRLWHAARTIFEIAIDEMRHFRWANEILKLLGSETTAARASMLGRKFKVPFYLQSLSSPQLQWFIDVERPSRSTVSGLDGMYVGILHSLQNLKDEELDPAKCRRAVETVKLIVDEGEGHYLRFSTAQQNFAFYDDAGRRELPSYVRCGAWSDAAPPTDPKVPYATVYGAPVAAAPGSNEAALQGQSDLYYRVLLILLKIAFAIQNTEVSGFALRLAIALMFKMNTTNFQLAEANATPLFTVPPGWEQDPPIRSRKDAQRLLAQARKLMQAPIKAMMVADRAPDPKLSTDPTHSASISEILDGFEDAIARARFSP